MTDVPAEVANHHGSHNTLLTDVTTPTGLADVDVVIVPTSRPVECLREAMAVARALRSPLVALCSRSARAADAAALGYWMGVDVIAVDVEPAEPAVPALLTDALLAGTQFRSRVDLSLKRNLGLLLATARGWQRALFLDDDISAGPADSIRAAAALLDQFSVVGLRNVGYPDNSVVCHAYREAGGNQGTFVGGGAMLVGPDASRGFFPNVYNEDWFFMLGDGGLRRIARAGQVAQRVYDPFATPDRARREEFGDSLGEGLYWLLDDGMATTDADESFWRDFLSRRRCFLHHVLAEVDRQRPHGWVDMIASLHAAISESHFVTPKLCREYVAAWETDRTRWQHHVAALYRSTDLEKCLAELGILGRTYRARRSVAAQEHLDWTPRANLNGGSFSPTATGGVRRARR